MKTGYQPRVKKLSTAIKIGKKIADENGIKHGRGDWIKLNKNGEIQCACALGLSLIGKHGVEEVTKFALNAKNDFYAESPSEKVARDFPASDKINQCLLKKTEKKKTIHSYYSTALVVMALNDNSKLPLEEIVETLEACKL